MFGLRKHFSGRVLLLRCEGPLSGEGLPPEQILTAVRSGGIRYLLLDATCASFIDTEGLRWLLRLRDKLAEVGSDLRIATRPHSRVWRNLRLLNVDVEIFESLRSAWKAPWKAQHT